MALDSETIYERSVCKDCRFNRGFMPCCDKVYCELYGLVDARSSCRMRV